MRIAFSRWVVVCLLGLALLSPIARTEDEEGDQPARGKSVPASVKPSLRPAGLKNLQADDWSNVVRAALDESDDQLSDDNSYFETWDHNGIAGELVTFELKSLDFDPYLMLFLRDGDNYIKLGEDNDGGLGRNARIQIRLEKTGTYDVMVNTASAGEKGWYSLHTRSQRPPPDAAGPSRVARIALDQRRIGKLQTGDRTLRDGSFFDVWNFTGTYGETVSFVMNTRAFKPYLIVAEQRGSELAFLHETGSKSISYQPPASGAYVLLANSGGAGQTGDYELNMIRDATAPPSLAELRARYPGGGNARSAYALVIGINDYPGEADDLGSCVADAQLFKRLLIHQFGFDPKNVVMLTDKEATRNHVIIAIQRHLGQVGPQGTAVLYYSGHGTRVKDERGPRDETDGMDEALALWGAPPRGTYLIDDEIGTLISQLRTERVLAVFDSCHSGTGTRGGMDLGAKVKSLDPNSLRKLYDPPAELILEEDGATRDIAARGHILLAAAGAEELSLAQPSAGPWPRHGGLASVFTYYLVDRLSQVDESTSFQAAMADVHSTVLQFSTRLGQAFQPQLEGEGTNRSVVRFLTGR